MIDGWKDEIFTNSEITVMITMPTLEDLGGHYELLDMNITAYLQLRFPSATLASVCPPRILFRMLKPHITIRLQIHGSITP